jgi:hypothetical protein
MKHRRWHRKLRDELAFRYGLQPWMLLLVVAVVLVVAAIFYFGASGRKVVIPVPESLEIPGQQP